MAKLFIGSITIDSANSQALAQFYCELLDGKEIENNEHFIQIEVANHLRMTFQFVDGYQPPVWPEEPGKQQQMEHLDIMVDNLEEAVQKAESLGAKRAEKQFIPGIVVMKDPAHHPFCLIPME